jgi:hypothetical protein
METTYVTMATTQGAAGLPSTLQTYAGSDGPWVETYTRSDGTYRKIPAGRVEGNFPQVQQRGITHPDRLQLVKLCVSVHQNRPRASLSSEPIRRHDSVSEVFAKNRHLFKEVSEKSKMPMDLASTDAATRLSVVSVL